MNLTITQWLCPVNRGKGYWARSSFTFSMTLKAGRPLDQVTSVIMDGLKQEKKKSDDLN